MDHLKLPPEQQLAARLKSLHSNSALFPLAQVIVVTDKSTIADTFKTLTDNQILSVPVVDSQTKKPTHIVGINHLVAYLVQSFKPEDFDFSFFKKLSGMFNSDSLQNVMKKPILSIGKDLADFKPLDQVECVDEDTDLLTVAKLMVNHKLKRIVVTNSSGEISSVLSQSRMLEVMSLMFETYPKVKKTLNDLNCGFRDVYSVKTSEKAYDAFTFMIKHNVSALPVLSDSGELISTISLTDFKLAAYDTKYWNMVGLPVSEYLEQLKSFSTHVHVASHVLTKMKKRTEKQVLHVTPHDKLLTVISTMATYKVHRVFIMDDKKQIVGVMSTQDVLKELIDDFNTVDVK